MGLDSSPPPLVSILYIFSLKNTLLLSITTLFPLFFYLSFSFCSTFLILNKKLLDRREENSSATFIKRNKKPRERVAIIILFYYINNTLKQ